MLLIKAPSAPRCCSKCGKMAALFLRPLDIESGVAAALAKRMGTESEIRIRIRDMKANGLLLETRP